MSSCGLGREAAGGHKNGSSRRFADDTFTRSRRWHRGVVVVFGAGCVRPFRTCPVGAGSPGHLRAAWSGIDELVTLDPARMNEVVQFQITSNVLSGLTHIDANLIAQPDAASGWDVSDDGKEYVFHLREGMKYHNGDPFTAEPELLWRAVLRRQPGELSLYASYPDDPRLN